MGAAQSGTFHSVAELLQGPGNLAGLVTLEDVKIRDLGRCPLPSPIARHLGENAMHFVGEADKVLVNDCISALEAHASAKTLRDLPAFELADPRNRSSTIRSRRQVSPTDDLWLEAIEAKGQPRQFA